MVQWQQVSPNFSRGITTAMSNAQQGISDVGRVAGDYLLRQDKLAQEEARKVERKQDVDFRQAQADQTQGNFLKSFSLQQNADDRAKAEQLAKENTRQAYGQFGELVTAPNQTQAQVQAIMRPDSILSKAQAQGRVLTPKEEAALLGQVNADLNKNKGSLTQQRQVLLEQGPVSELYDVVRDPVTGAETVRTRKDIDTTSQQDYKGKLLDNLDRRIGDEAKLSQDMSLAKLRMSFDEKENAKARAAARQATKDRPIMMHIVDDKGNIAYQTVYDQGTAKALQAAGWNLGGNIDRAPQPKDSKDSKLKLFTASPEAVGFREKVGGWDVDKVNRVGQRLQNTLNTTPEETAAILDQAIDTTIFDSELKEGRLRDVLYNMGYLKSGKNTSSSDKILKALTQDK